MSIVQLSEMDLARHGHTESQQAQPLEGHTLVDRLLQFDPQATPFR